MQYKILFVKNRFTGTTNFSRGLDWFKANTPLEIVTETISTDFDVTTKAVGNLTFHGVICGEDIFPKLKALIPENKYNLVVLLVGNDLAGIRVDYTDSPLYLNTDLVQICKPDVGQGKTVNHEMFHSFFKKLARQGIYLQDPMDSVVYNGQVIPYFMNDDMNAVPSNRSIALAEIKPYWDKVANFINNTPMQPMYKYFKASEIVGLKPELVSLLDTARGIAGIPFRITSGFRTPQNNVSAGGVQDSTHLTGNAVDLACSDSQSRLKMVSALLKVGFNRIGIYLDHLHADNSTDHPLNVMWVLDKE